MSQYMIYFKSGITNIINNRKIMIKLGYLSLLVQCSIVHPMCLIYPQNIKSIVCINDSKNHTKYHVSFNNFIHLCGHYEIYSLDIAKREECSPNWEKPFVSFTLTYNTDEDVFPISFDPATLYKLIEQHHQQSTTF